MNIKSSRRLVSSSSTTWCDVLLQIQLHKMLLKTFKPKKIQSLVQIANHDTILHNSLLPIKVQHLTSKDNPITEWDGCVSNPKAYYYYLLWTFGGSVNKKIVLWSIFVSLVTSCNTEYFAKCESASLVGAFYRGRYYSIWATCIVIFWLFHKNHSGPFIHITWYHLNCLKTSKGAPFRGF